MIHELAWHLYLKNEKKQIIGCMNSSQLAYNPSLAFPFLSISMEEKLKIPRGI